MIPRMLNHLLHRQEQATRTQSTHIASAIDIASLARLESPRVRAGKTLTLPTQVSSLLVKDASIRPRGCADIVVYLPFDSREMSARQSQNLEYDSSTGRCLFWRPWRLPPANSSARLRDHLTNRFGTREKRCENRWPPAVLYHGLIAPRSVRHRWDSLVRPGFAPAVHRCARTNIR